MAHQLPNGITPSRHSSIPHSSPPTAADSTTSTLSTQLNPARYRGATVADLDLPPALSVSPQTPVSSALLSASSHDYSHLTVLSSSTRSLVGYLPISRLQSLLNTRQLSPDDPVSKAMVRFKRATARSYTVITMETELWELEGFFEGVGPLSQSQDGAQGDKQDFAVVTDEARKFVLGVATRGDLEEFVRRRPA